MWPWSIWIAMDLCFSMVVQLYIVDMDDMDNNIEKP